MKNEKMSKDDEFYKKSGEKSSILKFRLEEK